jgi:methyl-accepting chemotaxis protein
VSYFLIPAITGPIGRAVGVAKAMARGDISADIPASGNDELGELLRAAFCTEIVGKSVANLKALWAQMVFSGKALPPKVAASDDDVKKAVSSAKGGVGYIKAAAADDTVKVAFK